MADYIFCRVFVENSVISILLPVCVWCVGCVSRFQVLRICALVLSTRGIMVIVIIFIVQAHIIYTSIEGGLSVLYLGMLFSIFIC